MFKVLQYLIDFALPPILERERYTLKTSPLLLVAPLPLLVASYVRLRYPNLPFLVKFVILITALPLVSHFILKRYFVQSWNDPIDNFAYSINYVQFVSGMAIGVIDLKFIELLFLGKDTDFEVKGWEEYSKMQVNGKKSSNASRYTLQRPAFFPGSYIPLEIDLVSTIRGQGYNWGPKDSKGGYKAVIESQQLLQKSAEVVSEKKWAHVRRIGLAALTNLMLMDACDSIIKNTNIFPAAGRHGGGATAEGAFGSFGSPLGPLLVTLATGVLIFVGLQANYALGYLIHLLVTPASQVPIIVGKWEPLPFNKPYAATSLSSFWSNHWHSFVRRTFTVFAYKPVLRISKAMKLNKQIGQIIALVATFALSGLLHEGCLEAQKSYFYDQKLYLEHDHLSLVEASTEMKKEYGFGAKHYATTYAFTIQAFFVTLESFWLRTIEPHVVLWVTGQKNGKVVDGRLRDFLGWLFTYTCMMYSGTYIVDVWHSHGLINANATLRLFQRTATFIHSHL